jgi:hypothetical protein
MRKPRRQLDLRPSYKVLDELSPPTSASDSNSAPRPTRAERPTASATKRRLDRLLAEDQAERDLKAGRVDPHLYALQRGAEKLLRPGWWLAEGHPGGLGTVANSTAAFVRELGRDYVRRLGEYNESQRYHPVGREPRSDMLDNYNRMMRAAADGADRLACSVCVVIGAGGSSEPKLARSSGRPPFDRLAVKAVRKAARLQAPPADLKSVQACYLAEARFHRVPPIPVVGCHFDESKPSLDCFYPTKKILRWSVKLQSVRPLPAAGS